MPTSAEDLVVAKSQVTVDVTDDGPQTSDSEARVQATGDFISEAKERFRTIADSEAVLRSKMTEDIEFRAGHQWPDTIKTGRMTDGRPCLTINRIPQFIRHVVNQMRDARPGIKVNAVDSEGDPETAKVYQGLIRHIEDVSNAEVAYSWGGEMQATCGRGYWRVKTKFSDLRTFKQEIVLQRVRNPLTVYADHASSEPDGSDYRYAFIIEDVPLPMFKRRFPNAALSQFDDWKSIGDADPIWMPEGKVRIAEYWYVDYTERTLLQVTDPNGISFTVFDDELEEVRRKTPHLAQGLTVNRTRKVDEPKVKFALVNGHEVLAGNDELTAGHAWAGKWIPIVPVLGDEIDINGRLDLRGMVRDAMDPQRMYNFWITAQTETIALAPRAPFIGAEGQFEGHEDKWKSANIRNWAYLEYRPKTVGGQLAPAPQRLTYEPPISAMVQATGQSNEDLKNVMGIHDASLGRSGPEQSGKAILARQSQSDIGNSNFMGNLTRSIKQTGRILVDLIPSVYDVPTMVRILGEDQQERAVMVFGQEQPTQAQRTAAGDALFDLGHGKYDVSVSVGPSTQTKRQEAVEMMTELIKAYPEAFGIIGDLLVQNMDWEGADEIALRLKKALPPNLQETPDFEQLSPEAQTVISGLQQQLEGMQQELQQAQQMIETDQVKAEGNRVVAQLEADSRRSIATLHEQQENLRHMTELDERKARSQMESEIKRMGQMLEHLSSERDRDDTSRNKARDRVQRSEETALKVTADLTKAARASKDAEADRAAQPKASSS